MPTCCLVPGRSTRTSWEKDPFTFMAFHAFTGIIVLNRYSAGTCAGGLEGVPCAFCPDGKSWTGDGCSDCGPATVGWVAAVSVALIGVRSAYFYTNSAAAWLMLRGKGRFPR
eukprot:s3451_g6.t1